MPVLQKKALFSAFIICQVLRIIQNYMEVSPAKSLILSATIHGGSYFFIQPKQNPPHGLGLTKLLSPWNSLTAWYLLFSCRDSLCPISLLLTRILSHVL